MQPIISYYIDMNYMFAERFNIRLIVRAASAVSLTL
nr:MAG TPA: hypothetical protein [Caudoviricetes sp.]